MVVVQVLVKLLTLIDEGLVVPLIDADGPATVCCQGPRRAAGGGG